MMGPYRKQGGTPEEIPPIKVDTLHDRVCEEAHEYAREYGLRSATLYMPLLEYHDLLLELRRDAITHPLDPKVPSNLLIYTSIGPVHVYPSGDKRWCWSSPPKL